MKDHSIDAFGDAYEYLMTMYASNAEIKEIVAREQVLREEIDKIIAEIEAAIISHIRDFLMEMGRGFAFVARQQHIVTETEDYYIDLVFYNIELKCYVLIDLKMGKITHQDVGQIDMYVRMYDELKCKPGDNPTIGILLCSETDEDIARYSVLQKCSSRAKMLRIYGIRIQ